MVVPRMLLDRIFGSQGDAAHDDDDHDEGVKPRKRHDAMDEDSDAMYFRRREEDSNRVPYTLSKGTINQGGPP